jgi:hypothetical protein
MVYLGKDRASKTRMMPGGNEARKRKELTHILQILHCSVLLPASSQASVRGARDPACPVLP